MVKCGFIADPEILRLVEETAPEDLTPASPVLRELVERAIRVKIDVVVADLKEIAGDDGHPGREVLNYGHTLAHAIDASRATASGTARRWRSAASSSPSSPDARAGSPVRSPTGTGRRSRGRRRRRTGRSSDDLHAAMRIDKKARGNQLRFVVLEDLARPVVLAGPAEDDLLAAYAAIGGDDL